jgi:hypothetical protein
VTQKLENEGTKPPGSIKRYIKKVNAQYPPFFFDMLKQALKAWIDESGETTSSRTFSDFR